MVSSRNSTIIILLVFGGFFLIFSVIFGSLIALVRLGLSEGETSGPRIGVVELTGVIEDSKDTSILIRQYEKDDDIKAVMLRINTPGGAVGPTQEIFADVLRLRKSKKVVASLGGVAASGGYYVASAADRIVANPGTITGSVGVLTQMVHVNDLLQNVGVTTTTFKSGSLKDSGSFLRPVEAGETALFESLIEDVFTQFLTDVTEQRRLDPEAIAAISDGRVMTGSQALKMGLVDELGNFYHAVEVLRELSELDDEVPVVFPRRRMPFFLRSMLDDVFGQATQSLQSMGGVKIRYTIPGTGF